MIKVTITLEEDILQFIDQQAQGNRSGYINALVTEHRRQILSAEMIAALKQDAQDSEYQAEIAAWDNVVGDGINAREYRKN
ncbi:MAG: CopG family transcriptional regulator [Brasilonema angustatum HA4187-MV1]|jgi:Arc/MetJ-type ribon-helix-helix transcriptional regulator|nr:CopG family transcriptional regulator [Brasilonema angustatum HA4187-MV1]